MSEMVSWKRLPVMFLAVALLLAVTLLGLGWQLARQDREVAAQRLQERRENAADLAVAALQKSLSQAEEQLTNLAALPLPELRRKGAAYAASLPDDSVLVVARGGEVDAWPEKRLPFCPVVPAAPGPPDSLFANAERLEFGQADGPKAIAVLRELARSRDPKVRAAALLRIARIHRKQGRWQEALSVYQEMSGVGNATVEGLPVDLVVLQARLRIFEHQKQDQAARQEALVLLAGLRERRWRLNHGAYEFYAGEAERVAGEGAEPARSLALAGAVESLHESWREEESRSGRRILREAGGAMLALWRGPGESIVALVAGPKWLESQLDGLGAALANQGVAIGLTDSDGHVILGPRPAEPARQSLRLASAVQLPWNLYALTTNPDMALASSQVRRRLLGAGLAVITLLILAGSYLVARAVTRELAVSRLQSDFVSAVSHEFRTPLTSLCLLSEQLAAGRIAGEPDRAEYYGVLVRDSQRLRRLVEGLLNFGRMQAGAMRYRFEAIDAAALVAEVAGEFQRDAEAGGCRIQVRANGDAPLVRADRAALACAVWNLLDNAMKYSPDCQTVWADIERADGCAAIRIRDRGLGIPAAEQGRIFKKFVRGEEARIRGIRGTGVGLAMVRHIVTAHGGEIRLESKEGEGSAFTVLLPAVG